MPRAQRHSVGGIETEFVTDDLAFDRLIRQWLRLHDDASVRARASESGRVAPDIRWEMDIAAPMDAPSGEPTIQFGPTRLWRDGNRIVARRGTLSAELHLVHGEGRVTASPADDHARWSALLDVVRPLWSAALSRRGLHPVHASGVAVDGRAVAVVGATGAGKSTLAAHLTDGGGVFLSDDVVLVADGGDQVYGLGDQSRFVSRPGDPAPTVDGKHAVSLGSAATGPCSPGLVVLIEAGDGPSRVTPVEPGGAMAVLLRSALRMLDPIADAARLNAVAELSSSCPTVHYHRGPTGLAPEEILRCLPT